MKYITEEAGINIYQASCLHDYFYNFKEIENNRNGILININSKNPIRLDHQFILKENNALVIPTTRINPRRDPPTLEIYLTTITIPNNSTPKLIGRTTLSQNLSNNPLQFNINTCIPQITLGQHTDNLKSVQIYYTNKQERPFLISYG